MDEFEIRPEGSGHQAMKQPLNALIVKEGEGEQEAVPIGDGHFHVEGNLEQLSGHHDDATC